MNNTEGQQFYVEKEGVGLEEIKIFVEYMLFQRTRDVREPYVDEHGFTSYISFLEYVPLSDGEELPDILFTTNPDFKPKEREGMCIPRLSRNETSKTGFSGKFMTPLCNKENFIQVHYNNGLREGNLNDLHMFACELNRMFLNNFQVSTWRDGIQRYFRFRNPKCEDPNFYYENEFVHE